MYHLYAGNSYYPTGGWHDHVGTYPTLMDALQVLANLRCDWWHVVSVGQIVAEGVR